ncbi:MAG: response regulator [Myxococcales bacterium]|nr:response regulator [Myxococcales bacterium]
MATAQPRVLVVDDDPGVLQSLKLLLEDDCEVTCSASPTNALSLALTNQFDVIVTDYKMPQMTGSEFAQAVKQQVTPVPYMLLLTGTPQSVTHTTPGAQDLVMVLAKPFEPDRLLRIVTQVGRLGLIRRGAVPGP